MIVLLHDELMPLERATVSPLDRGFLFGDGVYEGLRAFGGRVVGAARHVARLRAGLDAARIPFDASRLDGVCARLLEANGLRDAFIYVQVTRGTPGPGQPVRTRVPAGTLTPTVFAYAVPAPGLEAYATPPTKSCVTVRDTRWLRGRLKSISLMGSVLGGFEAHEAGAEDAIFVRDGCPGGALAAESTSANLVAVVSREGRPVAITPALDDVPILAGVTRDLLLEAASGAGIDLREGRLTPHDLRDAREVMLCGTLTMVTSVTTLDGRPVGDGTPGPVAGRLLALLCRVIREGTP
ncbi:MAG: aminotransferase class IV [Planctomycetota bacterium]|nr:aminotransferase class IV [Planctomycetota bacterium]